MQELKKKKKAIITKEHALPPSLDYFKYAREEIMFALLWKAD